jgi:hypothetical protein
MKPPGIKEFIISGLKIKAIQFGEYTSLIVQDARGKTFFRGAVIPQCWPKIKAAFDRLWVIHGDQN